MEEAFYLDHINVLVRVLMIFEIFAMKFKNSNTFMQNICDNKER